MSNLDVSKSTFYACIERENEELKNKITKLKKLAKKYRGCCIDSNQIMEIIGE